MCVQTFHMVNIDVPAGVGAPPLDKQLLYKMVEHNLYTNLSNLFPFFFFEKEGLACMIV